MVHLQEIWIKSSSINRWQKKKKSEDMCVPNDKSLLSEAYDLVLNKYRLPRAT